MDLTQHANSAYIWLQRTNWRSVQKYLFNTSCVANTTLTWAGDGEEDHRDASRAPRAYYLCGETSWAHREQRPVKTGAWWCRADCDGGSDAGRGEAGSGRGLETSRAGLGQEEWNVQGGAGTSQQANTEHPVGSSTGEGGRGCPEMSLYGDRGWGGTWLGRAIRALNVVCFLSAGFHDSPLFLMFCCPNIYGLSSCEYIYLV